MSGDIKPLAIGGVSLVKGRIRDVGLIMQDIVKLLEPRMESAGFLANAPFNSINLIIRFGDKSDLAVEYQRINKRDLELPVAVQLELAPLRMAPRDVAYNALLAATLNVLADIAKRYNLPPVSISESGATG